MARALKTLFLFEDLCFGGTQKQNLELAARLDRELFEPHLATLTGPTDLDAFASQHDLPLARMGKSRKLAPFFFLRLPSLLARIKPDIILPCTALPNIWGRIWGKMTQTPLIIGTCRGGGAPFRQHEKYLWRLTDAIVCNSEALLQVMANRGIPPEHLSYIPNGVDTDYYRPAPPPALPLITCVARLAKDKDHATLLRAFAQVATQMPQARLRLVGEGPEEERLRELADNILPAPARQRLEFAGASSDPRPHYQQASVVTLASMREGQPNVILEAMSCGRPVCATAVGGIPALVKDKVNGLLSPAGDSGSLADNLLRLLRDSTLAEAMGKQGRSMVEENFSFSQMVARHQELFLDLWRKKISPAKGE